MLANLDYAVVLTGRDPQKGHEALEYVRASSSASNPRVAFVQMEQSSLESVRRAAADVSAAADAFGVPLRGLLLNAGVWPQQKRLTADGIAEALAVNHVSHQLLARELLPTLLNGSGDEAARVVTVASSAHAFPAGVETSDPAWDSRRWDATASYGESKLANVYFARELALRVDAPPRRFSSLAVHPGVVATSLFREFGGGGAAAAPALGTLLEKTPLRLVLKTPADGARTLVYALVAPSLPSGSYLSDCELTDVSPAAKDARAASALWKWTNNFLDERLAQLDAAQESTRLDLARRAFAGGDPEGDEAERASDEPERESDESGRESDKPGRGSDEPERESASAPTQQGTGSDGSEVRD